MASSTRISVRRVARCWACGAGLDLHFGDFQVPVAELVPDKVVDRVGHVVQAVVGKALGHVGLDFLQARDDPAVGLAEVQVALVAALGAVRCAQAAVLALAVHQHKAAGVPQLVAEVAVALAALAVKVDAAAQAGQRGKGEAQRVGTVGGDAVGEFFFGGFAHFGGRFGAAQAWWCAFPAGAPGRCRRSSRPGRARCPRICSSSCPGHRAPGRGCTRA